MKRLLQLYDRADRARPMLTRLSVAMLLLAVATTAAGLFDGTIVEGQNRWIKPTKFALSAAAYTFTTAWLLSYLSRTRLARGIELITASVMVLELIIIVGQAARGRVSHFNTETAMDGALFTVMGIGIGVVFLSQVALLWIVARSDQTDRVLATGMTVGLLVGLVGSAEGALMTRPTDAQIAEIAQGRQPARMGAHSVGVPDGGHSYRGTGWSAEGGDLRPAHFFGMHALQLLPLLAFLLLRMRWSDARKIRLLWTAGLTHLALTLLLTFQALRGQPLFEPDRLTVGLLITILFMSGTAVFLIAQSRQQTLAEVTQ